MIFLTNQRVECLRERGNDFIDAGDEEVDTVSDAAGRDRARLRGFVTARYDSDCVETDHDDRVDGVEEEDFLDTDAPLLPSCTPPSDSGTSPPPSSDPPSQPPSEPPPSSDPPSEPPSDPPPSSDPPPDPSSDDEWDDDSLNPW